MERVILEMSRTAVRMLATDGPPEQPRLRLARVEPLRGALEADTLRRALRGLHRARTNMVIMTIPREEVMVRIVRLPAPAQFPFPHDQLVSDVRIIGQEEGAKLAQVVACPRPRLQTRLALLQEIGWEPDLITPGSWGLWAWYRRSADRGQHHGPTAVLHLDVDRADLLVLDGDRLVFSRGLSPSVEEVERTLAAASKAWPALPIRRLVVTGVGDLERWTRLLERRMDTSVVEEGSAADASGGSLTLAWGAAMAERRWLVNLAPQDVQQHRRRHTHLRRSVLAGSLLCAMLALGDGLLAGLLRRQARLEAAAHEPWRQGETVAGPLLQHEHAVAVLEAFLVSRRQTKMAVAELFRLTPPDVVFEEVAFDRARHELLVRGSTATTARVMDYLHLLEQSRAWGQVALRHAMSRREAEGIRTDFEILLAVPARPESRGAGGGAS